MLQPKRKENELGCSISKLNFSNILQSPSVYGNPDFGIWKILLVEFENLGTGIRNTAQGIHAESH